MHEKTLALSPKHSKPLHPPSQSSKNHKVIDSRSTWHIPYLAEVTTHIHVVSVEHFQLTEPSLDERGAQCALCRRHPSSPCASAACTGVLVLQA